MKYITTFKPNAAGDGQMPVCPYCGYTYPDACFGEVKNYPDDGRFAVFMQCENCDKEAQILFSWVKRDRKL